MDSLTLDDLDEQLVHALQVDGRASFSRIAEVLGASDRTIARRYHRLRSAGAVRVIGLLDSRRVGRVDWLVRIQCAPDAALAVAATLAHRNDTSWVSLTSGGTEVTCVTHTHHQGTPLLRKLPRGPRIVSVTAQCMLRAVAGTSGWHGRTAALTPDQIDQLSPVTCASGAPVDLTDADRRLVAELAKDGRTSYPDLAAATGIPESTARRRLAELRHDGVLYFDVDVDSLLFGYTTEAALWLTVAPTELTAVATDLARHPQVAFAAAVTGPTNMFAFVVCRDPDALYDYLATQVGALRGVLQVETAPIMRSAKRSGALMIRN
ncbi:Lrp/AsnC family transcriptional regulator [Actinocrispum wychmicini]|uniref:Lrp/AsnC family transcriptional regulator n=1 Tax=Actinocrispum wychmicini TaxID=1213861 RepID=UPI001A9E58D1|nr:AsnC family transcriptional regulator [Actinocrispum wychmicini]